MTDADMHEMLERLETARRAAEQPIEATDDDRLVVLNYAESATVTISRSLCPDPEVRSRIELAVGGAVDALITGREQEQRAVADQLGSAMSRRISDEMRAPMAEFDGRVDELKQRIRASTERAERRRNR